MLNTDLTGQAFHRAGAEIEQKDHLWIDIRRPLKKVQFFSSSRKTKILTTDIHIEYFED
jgi:hypothetical protein